MQPQALNINPTLRYDVASCGFFHLSGLLGLWQGDDGKDTAYMGALHRNVLVQAAAQQLVRVATMEASFRLSQLVE